MTRVTFLQVVAPYGLDVRFSDGSGGVHNCAPLLQAAGGDVLALKDPHYFATVALDPEWGAPTWPNGVDMDPEWLRRQMDAAGELRLGIAAE